MYENIALLVFLAYLLDLVAGEPKWIPHPVVLIGKAIDGLERLMRRVAKRAVSLRLAGALTAVLVVGASWSFTYMLICFSLKIHYLLGAAVSVLLISTTIAARGLANAAKEIFYLLEKGDLTEARRKVGWIVGRDTGNLDKTGVTRATVETVAENIVDGVVSPIFYAFIGGAPMAIAYKAVNTLDSMLGYKNERYIDYGRFSAQMDDIANYVPARLTGIIIVCAAFILQLNPRRAMTTILRDAAGHPSPNSGIPESAVAGALGVRLGGLNYYQGRESFRSYMGDEIAPLEPYHITQTVKIMYLTSSLVVIAGVFLSLLINRCI